VSLAPENSIVHVLDTSCLIGQVEIISGGECLVADQRYDGMTYVLDELLLLFEFFGVSACRLRIFLQSSSECSVNRVPLYVAGVLIVVFVVRWAKFNLNQTKSR
jgi:hypothetical protein